MHKTKLTAGDNAFVKSGLRAMAKRQPKRYTITIECLDLAIPPYKPKELELEIMRVLEQELYVIPIKMHLCEVVK
jgi:hypothetical protein